MMEEEVNIKEKRRVSLKWILFSLSRLLFNNISYSPYGVKKLLIVSFVNFASKSGDKNIDNVCLRIKVIMPYFFHNKCF